MVEFRFLGKFEVQVDGAPIAIPSRAAQSLLAFLLLHRSALHRREKLAGLFWPQTSETNARRSLRQELWRLRKLLSASSTARSDLLLSDDLAVSIDPQADYYLDVAVLETPLSSSPSADGLTRSLKVYQGELLPDFYDEWVVPERERLRSLFEHRIGHLLELLQAQEEWAELVRWAEHWISLSRSPEPAYRALMLAHCALGNRAQVALVYERCANTLQDDLGVEPSDQTRALYQELVEEQRPGKPAAIPRPTVQPPVTLLEAAEGEPPYKGLHYFEPDDAEWFFGRERLVASLVSHLEEHHLLTVVGASGSGKSSLVRAGLLPALKHASRHNGGAPAGYVMTPTAHPLEALAVTLTRNASSLRTTANLMDDFAHDARSLRLYFQTRAANGSSNLLVIDQFEELFTLCRDEREREAFINNLLLATAAELDRPLHVVVALRADFYAHCAQYANLREGLARRQEYIGPMTTDELRRAIEGPAQRGSWEFEPGLVELILRDVGAEPGALPLLSHALLETWKRRQGRLLTLEGYAKSGGVQGAISQTAETVFAQLPPDGQQLARHIFLHLTELGEGTQDTRRRVLQKELVPAAAEAEQVQEVLNRLAEARLVTLGEDTAEVAHEALIREWPALREWLNQDREGLRLRRRLRDVAQGWEKLDRDAGELYRGMRLAQALEWAKGREGELTRLEQEFLNASCALQEQEEAERAAQQRRQLEAAQRLAEEERKRAQAESQHAQAEQHRAEEQARANRQLRRRAWYLAGALMVAAVLALVSLFLAQQASADAARAEQERRIAVVSDLSVNAVNNLFQDPQLSLLLALQAVSAGSEDGQNVPRKAEEALHRAVQASQTQLKLFGHTAALWDVSSSPDGKRLATASHDTTARVWDAETGDELLTLCCHESTVSQTAFSPDGTRLATASADATARIWDISPSLASGSAAAAAPAVEIQELLTLRGHNDWVRGVAFSPDGQQVATASLDGTAKVWDAATGRELLTLSGDIGGVSSIAFSPDGSRLVTGSYSAETGSIARVWDTVTGKLLLTLQDKIPQAQAVTVNAVAYTPDGNRITTASMDGAGRVWDASTGELLSTVLGNTETVFSVAFSPDGTRLATAGDEGTVKLWDSAAGTDNAEPPLILYTPEVRTLPGITFDNDGTRLVVTSNNGAINTYVLSLDELIRIAKSRLTRTFTTDECIKYLHVEQCPP
jgi:DNA-binding SARP family transcriptional activator